VAQPRKTIIGGVVCLFISAASLLIFGFMFLLAENDWVLGLLMIIAALVSVGAGLGVLRGFRHIISRTRDERN
jgi:hypothetical protein